MHRESSIFKKKPQLIPKKGWKSASNVRNTDVREKTQKHSMPAVYRQATRSEAEVEAEEKKAQNNPFDFGENGAIFLLSE